MREEIEFILKHNKDADATQIAEVLWLSKFLPKKEKPINSFFKKAIIPFFKFFKKSSGTFSKKSIKAKNINSNLPKEVTHTIVISKSQKNPSSPTKSKKNAYTPIRQKSSASYGGYIPLETELIFIKEQFRLLKIKQIKISKKELDENKSAEYTANTNIIHPIFKTEKLYKPYFDLNIVVDSSKSMFLWQESIEFLIQELKYSTYFKNVKIIKFNSDENLENFKYIKKLNQPKQINLIITDTVGKAWHNNQMYLLINKFSSKSFSAIVSMLPKQMWLRTSLREGESIYLKNKTFPPTNKTLQAEYAFIEKSFSKNSIKIPVIPYDSIAFEYLSKVIVANKNNLIESRVFQDLKTISIDTKESNLDAKSRVKYFFNSAQPNARELAIYCSILPLNKTIIKEVIKRKKLGNIDTFAEFYFGGLLDKNKKVELGEYDFYDGVQKELLNYISIEVAKELWEILKDIITNSLNVRYGFIELLQRADNIDSLTKKEQILAQMLINILKEKGIYYQKDIDKINSILEINKTNLNKNSFLMGSNDGYSDEKPVHRVTFDYNFEIAKYPVTFEEYDLFCKDTGRKKPDDNGWGRGKRPVINVSWDDAKVYCDWLNKKLGIEENSPYRYRLPTEAEWEYACRAGTTTKWSFGDNEEELEKYAWYNKNSNGKTHPVGEKLPNPWGLYDMHGNVFEWCEDDYIDNYKKTPRDGSAYKSGKEDLRKVVRGGSWDSLAYDTRSSYRYFGVRNYQFYFIGFRLLRTLP